jgi:hypothetical protein
LVLRDIEIFEPGLFSTGISELKTGAKKTQGIRLGYFMDLGTSVNRTYPDNQRDGCVF